MLELLAKMELERIHNFLAYNRPGDRMINYEL
jgi:hypothetical protein